MSEAQQTFLHLQVLLTYLALETSQELYRSSSHCHLFIATCGL